MVVGFCVLSYQVHRRPAEGAVGATPLMGDGSGIAGVNEFLATQAMADDDFILSVRCADLPQDIVLSLQSFIDQRMSKGVVYAGSGQTAPLDNAMCYYCLLRRDPPIAWTAAATQNSEGSPYYSQEYVVCFVHSAGASETADFDLFKPELDSFCLDLRLALFGSSDPNSSCDPATDDVLFQQLSAWSSRCLDYLPRCLDHLGDSLAPLLCAVLQGRSIVCNTTPEFAQDASKFCEACSILPLMQSSDASSSAREFAAIYAHVSTRQPNELLPYSAPRDMLPSEATETEELLEIWRRPLQLTINAAGECHLEEAKPSDILHSDYCESWANKLRATYLTIRQVNEADKTLFTFPALHLRHLIETFKIKAIQELTMVRRMVRKAEVDHYSLFNCFQQLQEHNNRDVLIMLMLRETILLMPNADSCQVLLLIRSMLRQGTTKWPVLTKISVR